MAFQSYSMDACSTEESWEGCLRIKSGQDIEHLTDKRITGLNHSLITAQKKGEQQLFNQDWLHFFQILLFIVVQCYVFLLSLGSFRCISLCVLTWPWWNISRHCFSSLISGVQTDMFIPCLSHLICLAFQSRKTCWNMDLLVGLLVQLKPTSIVWS